MAFGMLQTPYLNNPLVRPSLPKLPLDILHLIAEEHLCGPGTDIDYTTLCSLTLTNKRIATTCQRILFRNIIINLQRVNARRSRAVPFASILDVNPDIANYVHSLSICDHLFTDYLQNNEAAIPSVQWNSVKGCYSHNNMILQRKPYRLIHQCGKRHRAFTDALRKLTRLKSVKISFFYNSLSFHKISRDLRQALCHLIACQKHLVSLTLHGISELPFDLLARFFRLQQLRIMECSLGETDAELQLQLQRGIPLMIGPYDEPSQRLLSIQLRNIPHTAQVKILFDIWEKSRMEKGIVNMARPERVELLFGAENSTLVPRQFLEHATSELKALHIHTLALGISYSHSVILLNGYERDLNLVDDLDHGSQWFRPEMLIQPQDVEGLHSLETLELFVSFWDSRTVPVGGPNHEIDYAFNILRSVPADKIRRVVLGIKLGGFRYNEITSSIFKDFMAARNMGLWNRWRDELSKSKWESLEIFCIRILAPVDFAPYIEDLRKGMLSSLTEVDAWGTQRLLFQLQALPE